MAGEINSYNIRGLIQVIPPQEKVTSGAFYGGNVVSNVYTPRANNAHAEIAAKTIPAILASGAPLTAGELVKNKKKASHLPRPGVCPCQRCHWQGLGLAL
jgi:hypothetical protein